MTISLTVIIVLLILLVLAALVFVFLRGYRKGYEYARALVGADKLPAYDTLPDEMP